MMIYRGEELPLRHKYLRLYNNSLKKDSKVGELGVWHNNGNGSWMEKEMV